MRPGQPRNPEKVEALRQWLADVAQQAIDWLDELDAADEDREDDELGDSEAADD